MRSFEPEEILIFALVISIIGLAVLYYVIKWAVKSAIIEAEIEINKNK